jgi:hypothetical protein
MRKLKGIEFIYYNEEEEELVTKKITTYHVPDTNMHKQTQRT